MRHSSTHYNYNNVSHTISFNTSGSTAQSSDTSSGVNTLRLVATEDVYVRFDGNDASSTVGVELKAGIPEYFACEEETKVTARGASNSGSLRIDEMTM